MLLHSSKCQLRDLRIQATKTKPLEEQVRTLAELVERKSSQLQIASATLAKATEHHRRVEQELADAEQELAQVEDMRAEEALNVEFPVNKITGGHIMDLDKLANLLPPGQADAAKRGLRLLVPLLTAGGMTPPTHSPAASECGNITISSIQTVAQDDPYVPGASVEGSEHAVGADAVNVRAAGLYGPIPAFPRVRGRSANRTKVLERVEPYAGRGRSPSQEPRRRRLRAKSCMPLGFPVDERLNFGSATVFHLPRQDAGAL